MNLVVRDLGLSIARQRLCSGLSFQVKPGELWCVLGRNGAGKTTLLRTLAGLRDPDEGSIELHGVALASWRRPELARTRGFMPQAQTDSFSCSVLETILTNRDSPSSGVSLPPTTAKPRAAFLRFWVWPI
jgi:iron complex transport system ATP-binding protein